jgi:hypothetical protein
MLQSNIERCAIDACLSARNNFHEARNIGFQRARLEELYSAELVALLFAVEIIGLLSLEDDAIRS